jgi:hypothetical protein
LCTKLIELFANRVVERKNMTISISAGELALRVLGGVDFRGGVLSFSILSFSCSVCFDFEFFFAFFLGLSLFMPFVDLAVFPLLDLFLAFLIF